MKYIQCIVCDEMQDFETREDVNAMITAGWRCNSRGMLCPSCVYEQSALGHTVFATTSEIIVMIVKKRHVKSYSEVIMRHIEDNEQMMLFDWAMAQSRKYPELEFLHHIPNGGKRDAREAARFKRMGVKSGVPDISLPVPRGKYHGMYIEMKSPKGKLSDNQRLWLERLSKLGYVSCVCFSFGEARDDILKYLKGEM